MAEFLSFSVAPGAVPALLNTKDTRAYWVFEGDLNQMGLIYLALLKAGFPVVKRDVFPGFPRDQKELYIEALRYVYEARVEGWWNQERNLINYGICSQQGFNKVLGRRQWIVEIEPGVYLQLLNGVLGTTRSILTCKLFYSFQQAYGSLKSYFADDPLGFQVRVFQPD